MTIGTLFHGPNAAYALDLYERFQHDPASVDAATRALFERLPSTMLTREISDAESVARGGTRAEPTANGLATASHDVAKVVGAARLARSIREFGHLAANIDPLGAPGPGDPMLDPATHGINDADLARLPATIVWPAAGPAAGSCLAAIERLRAIYSGSLGFDLDHVQDFEERRWLHDTIEGGEFATPLDADERRELLARLSEVEEFERFLHSTFQGQKRFSIEGTDTVVPMLDELVARAAGAGAHEVLIGMAHRGRLNVLAHVLGKPYSRIFSEFHAAPNKDLVPSEGSTGINFGWTGDVKYHLGARKALRDGDLVQIILTLAHNPSHLEYVNPVVLGSTRAAQERRGQPGPPSRDIDRAICVTIHGDAAFPGEGVVAESLNLSRLPGYTTGGTIHIILNNQVGFTTEPGDARSTLYASDLAKGFEIPIVHVNADDPEACLVAVRMAHAYRERFHKDFLIDLVGYRRWGHNEGDEPAYTQPVLYAKIAEHPTVRAKYAEHLVHEGIVPAASADEPRTAARARLDRALQELSGLQPDSPATPRPAPSFGAAATGVPLDALIELNDALLERPAGFTPHPRLERQLERRREILRAGGMVDWGHAEALAFASILSGGTAIRLTGQDAERGTFSHRHAVLHDVRTGKLFSPLQALPQARASFAVFNSPLSEAAPLGFEYGYSVHVPSTLVVWEAQFGDFANAGQVIIDQFIAGARAKWQLEPSLVLLLPHGYEGQGPEHSSARLERFLQLAGEENLRVANCTTAAQYFHLLRQQVALLHDAPRPLVVMTPKSLLRHPFAASPALDFTSGSFQPVLDDPRLRDIDDQAAVRRLVLCSGKVAVDLLTSARAEEARDVAIARVELLYPFPDGPLRDLFARYSGAGEVVWLQEEPRNMGAYRYIAPQLERLLPPGATLRYVGRPARAATAEGAADLHASEQARLVNLAFDAVAVEEPEAIGSRNAAREGQMQHAG